MSNKVGVEHQPVKWNQMIFMWFVHHVFSYNSSPPFWLLCPCLDTVFCSTHHHHQDELRKISLHLWCYWTERDEKPWGCTLGSITHWLVFGFSLGTQWLLIIFLLYWHCETGIHPDICFWMLQIDVAQTTMGFCLHPKRFFVESCRHGRGTIPESFCRYLFLEVLGGPFQHVMVWTINGWAPNGGKMDLEDELLTKMVKPSTAQTGRKEYLLRHHTSIKRYEQWPASLVTSYTKGGETPKILYTFFFQKFGSHHPPNQPFMAMVLHQQTSKSKGRGQRSLSVSWNQCKCSRKDPRQIWRTAFFLVKPALFVYEMHAVFLPPHEKL